MLTDEQIRDLWSRASAQDQGPETTQQHAFARNIEREVLDSALRKSVRIVARGQAEPKRLSVEVNLDPHDGYWRVALCAGIQEFEFNDTWGSPDGAESYAKRLRAVLRIGDSDAD